MAAASVAEIGKVVRRVIGEEQGDTNEATLKAVQRVIKLLNEQVIPRLPEASPPDEEEPDPGDEQPRRGYGRASRTRTSARAASALVADVLEGYDATPQTEQKLLQSELSSRLAELDSFIPADDSVPSATMVKAIFDYSGEITQLAEEVAARSGVKTDALETYDDEEVAAHDFSFPTYAEFLENEDAIDAYVSTDSELGTRGDPAKGALKIVGKLLSAFGLSGEMVGGVMYALDMAAGEPWREMVRYVSAKKWSRVAGPLKRVLNAMLSKRFRAALAKKVGAKAAAKAAARIASRFLPIVGWATFVVAYIAAVAKQWPRRDDSLVPEAG